ncbi:Regulator of sigma-E protease RseP [Mesoplasma lactucae ATCC 49193]|nr:inner membrane zinc metalloprotease [Mesoplasma lactucae ATCC 49193]MCL8216824.1 Regulator of sigma-E protease RseP [Mesoplasma lactucae ATCC 49193]
MIVLAFFVGIIAILLLITLHEFGHFIVAKLCGAYVYEFSIGFGPALKTWKGEETWIVLRAFPLGGYVSIASDRSDPPKGREDDAEKVPDSRKMDYIARWKKALFILAGPVMNMVIAIVMISIIFMATLQKTDDMSFYGNRYDQGQIAYNLIKDDIKGKNKESFEQNDQHATITGWEVVLAKKDVDMTKFLPDYNHVTPEFYTNAKDNGYIVKFSNLPELKRIFGKDENGLVKELSNNNSFIYQNENPEVAVDYTKLVYNFIDNFKSDKLKITEADKEIVGEDYYSAIRFSYGMLNNGLYDGKFITENDSNNLHTQFSTPYVDSNNIKKTENFVLNGKHSSVGVKAPTRYFKNTTVAYGYSWKEFGNQSIAILKAFGLLFTGHITQLAGPVGVANQTAQMLTSAPTFFLYVAGLSANLFVLNLIPIPPLDGYKFFENAVEACIKKEIPQKAKIWMYTIGGLAFAALFIVITIKDLVVG